MRAESVSRIALLALASALVPGSLAQSGAASDPAKPKTYTEILATRPAPDLAALAERSGPERVGDDASEAYWDILKLRNQPNAKAVPALEAILAANRTSARIHGFAAAEALYCIKTPEALAILDKALLAPEYRANMGIMYAFHSEMPAGPRSEFIKRYHLKNLAKDVSVTLTAAPMRGDELTFTLTLKNLTKEPLNVDGAAFDQECLYFENAQGRIAWTRESGIRERLAPLITLAAEEKHAVTFALHAQTLGVGDEPDLSLPAEQKLYLESGGVQFMVGAPGEFKVYALLDCPKASGELRPGADAGRGTAWSGRAVSEPIGVGVGAAVK